MCPLASKGVLRKGEQAYRFLRKRAAFGIQFYEQGRPILIHPCPRVGRSALSSSILSWQFTQFAITRTGLTQVRCYGPEDMYVDVMTETPSRSQDQTSACEGQGRGAPQACFQLRKARLLTRQRPSAQTSGCRRRQEVGVVGYSMWYLHAPQGGVFQQARSSII